MKKPSVMPQFSSTLRRAALGRMASLGDVYDAKTDSFLSISVLNTSVPLREAVIEIDIPSTGSSYTTDTTYDQKFKMSKVNADLGASFLSGMIDVQGSGLFLEGSRNSGDSECRALYMFSCTTKQQKLNFNVLSNADLRSNLNVDLVKRLLGSQSHVVAEIEWGARSILDASYPSSEPQDKKSIDMNFKNAYNSFQESALEPKFSQPRMSQDGIKTLQNDLRFDIYGDLVAGLNTTAVSFDQACDHITKLRDIIQETNEGKGRPVEYILLPIESLATILDLENIPENTLKRPSPNCLWEFMDFFENLGRENRRLEEQLATVKDHDFCVPKQYQNDLHREIRRLKATRLRLKEQYTDALINVRSGYADVTMLWDLLDTYKNESLSNTFSVPEEEIKERINYANTILSKGGRLVNSKQSLCQILLENKHKDVFVLYTSHELRATDESWSKASTMFAEVLETKQPEYEAIVFDCDLGGKSMVEGFIEYYPACRATASKKRESLIPEAPRFRQGIRSSEDLNSERPPGCVAFQMPCPKYSCRRGGMRTWVCEDCREVIEHSEDNDFLYCGCGRVSSHSCELKCDDQKHGLLFVPFSPLAPRSSPTHERVSSIEMGEAERHYAPANDPPKLKSNTYEFEELNLVVLGETKKEVSFFLNSFINHIKFSELSFDEAAHKSLAFDKIVDFEFEHRYVDSTSHIKECKVMLESGDDSSEVYRVFEALLGEINAKLRFVTGPPLNSSDWINSNGRFRRKGGLQTFLESKGIEKVHGYLFFFIGQVLESASLHNIFDILPKCALEKLYFCYDVDQRVSKSENIHWTLRELYLRYGKCANYAFFDAEDPLWYRNVIRIDSTAFKDIWCQKTIENFPRTQLSQSSYASTWHESTATSCYLLNRIRTGVPYELKTGEELEKFIAVADKIVKVISKSVKKRLASNKLTLDDHRGNSSWFIQIPLDYLREDLERFAILKLYLEPRISQCRGSLPHKFGIEIVNDEGKREWITDTLGKELAKIERSVSKKYDQNKGLDDQTSLEQDVETLYENCREIYNYWF